MAARTRQPKLPKPPRQPRANKPKAVHVKKPRVGTWHEAAQTPRGALVGHQTAAHLAGVRGTPLHATGGSPALDLMAGTGLSGVILDLVGEGHLPLVHALDAFQREQDRVANRAWRRPGGMVRMGGL